MKKDFVRLVGQKIFFKGWLTFLSRHDPNAIISQSINYSPSTTSLWAVLSSVGFLGWDQCIVKGIL